MPRIRCFVCLAFCVWCCLLFSDLTPFCFRFLFRPRSHRFFFRLVAIFFCFRFVFGLYCSFFRSDLILFFCRSVSLPVVVSFSFSFMHVYLVFRPWCSVFGLCWLVFRVWCCAFVVTLKSSFSGVGPVPVGFIGLLWSFPPSRSAFGAYLWRWVFLQRRGALSVDGCVVFWVYLVVVVGSWGVLCV